MYGIEHTLMSIQKMLKSKNKHLNQDTYIEQMSSNLNTPFKYN